MAKLIMSPKMYREIAFRRISEISVDYSPTVVLIVLIVAINKLATWAIVTYAWQPLSPLWFGIEVLSMVLIILAIAHLVKTIRSKIYGTVRMSFEQNYQNVLDEVNSQEIVSFKPEDISNEDD